VFLHGAACVGGEHPNGGDTRNPTENTSGMRFAHDLASALSMERFARQQP
jgi:hypothetical protein